jgi:hypothetical protein
MEQRLRTNAPDGRRYCRPIPLANLCPTAPNAELEDVFELTNLGIDLQAVHFLLSKG